MNLKNIIAIIILMLTFISVNFSSVVASLSSGVVLDNSIVAYRLQDGNSLNRNTSVVHNLELDNVFYVSMLQEQTHINKIKLLKNYSKH